MIDIIIPCYNSHNTLKNTLFSIMYQVNVKDVNVYLIDDCSEVDYSEEVNMFKKYFNIKQIRLDKNSGPGTARKVGLRESNAPYITFIDSDDSFASPIALLLLYNAIKEDDYDLVISKTYEETCNNVLEKGHNTIWVHGKLYSRKFLNEHNITFNDTRANEDNGFNQLICLLNPKIKHIDYFTYIWRFNDVSITRSNNFDYAYSGLVGYAYNMVWALESASKYDYNVIKFSELSYAVMMALYYYYVIYSEKDGVEELAEYAAKLKRLYELNPISEDRCQQIRESQFDTVYKDKGNRRALLNPCMTLNDFIKKIEVIK